MFADASLMWKRQSGDGSQFVDNNDNDTEDDNSWWWSPAGFTVRYIIVALIFALVLLYFIGGYYHANRRTRRGLAPLPYHRWMVQRRVLASQPRYNPQYPQYAAQPYPQEQAYRMDGYAPPPPAYNHEHAPPPAYQPPQGGSKVMADQSFPVVQVHGAGESSTGVSAPLPARQQDA